LLNLTINVCKYIENITNINFYDYTGKILGKDLVLSHTKMGKFWAIVPLK